MLDTEGVARRLGVKVSTVYAYVSRGFLSPVQDGRRSLFSEAEVESLLLRTRGSKNPTGQQLLPISTKVTDLTPDGSMYRGTLATELATEPFERVASLIWQFPDGPWEPIALPEPPELSVSDLLHWTVVMGAAANPLRSDIRPESTVRSARQMIASVVNVVSLADRRPRRSKSGSAARSRDSIAERLFSHLSVMPTDPKSVEALNAALVLYSDHGIGIATLAVRLAASVRSSLYDAYLAGFGTLASTLGIAGGLALEMLQDAEDRGTRRAIDDTLRHHGSLPGFGPLSYADKDARAGALMTFVDPILEATKSRVISEVVEITSEHGLPIDLDFAVGALMYATGMPIEAGKAIFATGRMAGWAAHYLEELQERPQRFRTDSGRIVLNP